MIAIVIDEHMEKPLFISTRSVYREQ